MRTSDTTFYILMIKTEHKPEFYKVWEGYDKYVLNGLVKLYEDENIPTKIITRKGENHE